LRWLTLQSTRRTTYIRRMEPEVIKPQSNPRPGSQAFSPLGCFLSAAGATLLTLTLLGAAAAASVWAIIKLLGLPDSVLMVGLALAAIPVLAATLWVMGRAWHVERRLAEGLDIDTPVFKLRHYLQAR
jgi:uncharacterized paraquat-inducible protein A